MTDLVLCRSCERHFRPGDTQCPFCSAAAPAAAKGVSAPRGLSRAKLYALHTAALATSVAVVVACGGGTTTGADASTDGNAGGDGTAKDGATDVNGDVMGDVVADASGNDAAADVVEDDGWGPPPPPYGCVFPGGCVGVVV